MGTTRNGINGLCIVNVKMALNWLYEEHLLKEVLSY